MAPARLSALIGTAAAGLMTASSAAAHPHGPDSEAVEGPPAAFDPAAEVHAVLAPAADAPPERRAYVADFVEMALQEAGASYTLEMGTAYNESAALPHILGESHHGATVAVAPPMAALTERLAPLYVPVFFGLEGYRLLAVPAGDSDRFAGATSLDVFAQATAAVTPDDAALFAANDLPAVTRAPDAQLAAVASGEADYAALGPARVRALRGDDALAGADLAIAEGVALAEKTDAILYTDPDAGNLAPALNNGLIHALESGALAAFRDEHPYLQARRAALDLVNRAVWRLESPESDARRALGRAPSAFWLQE